MNTNQTNFTVYLTTSTKKIENVLIALAKEQHTSAISEVKTLQKQFTDTWFGGKMLRGTLVKLGYELVQGKQTAAILTPAAAFEILHTALLIHDDIIDKSATRRGKPALHVHKNSHYGMSQAICLGDIGIALSGKLLAESAFPKERKNKALAEFFTILHQTILGEMMDVVSAQKIYRTEEEVLQIHKMKTAEYTLVGPFILGAMLGGASEELVMKLTQFAQPLGIAYQIQDDILGIFGEEKKLGKSTLSDIEENKSTLLITYALNHANEKQKKELITYYGKKNITREQQALIKQLFIATGALEYNNKKIEKLMQKTKQSIPQLSHDKNTQLLLTQLCDFLIIRTK